MSAVSVRFWKAPGQIYDPRQPAGMKNFRECIFSDKKAAFGSGYDLDPDTSVVNTATTITGVNDMRATTNRNLKEVRERKIRPRVFISLRTSLLFFSICVKRILPS